MASDLLTTAESWHLCYLEPKPLSNSIESKLTHFFELLISWEMLADKQWSLIYFHMQTKQCCNEDWKWTKDEYEDSSVSENGPKTNTKNLWSLKIANSSNTMTTQRFSKGNEKFSLLKIFFQAATWTNFPSKTKKLCGEN